MNGLRGVSGGVAIEDSEFELEEDELEVEDEDEDGKADS